MTIAISLFCVVIVMLVCIAILAGVSLWVMYSGRNEMLTGRVADQDWTLRFLHRSETVLDFVKILLNCLRGQPRNGKTMGKGGGQSEKHEVLRRPKGRT